VGDALIFPIAKARPCAIAAVPKDADPSCFG
jgi:hypothetical protein